MIVLCSLLICFFSIFILIWMCSLFTHISMVKENARVYKWGTYRDFKRRFRMVNWNRDINFPKSFFGTSRNYKKNYIHADILIFNNIGMILRPVSYLSYLWFLHKNKYRGNYCLGRW